MRFRHAVILLLGMGWGCAAERPPGVRDNDRSGTANDPNENGADGGIAGSSVTGSSTNGASGSDDPTGGTETNDGDAGDGTGGASVGGGVADPTDSGGANAAGGASGAGAPGASGAEADPSAAGSGPDSSMPDETETSEMVPAGTAYPPGPYGEGSPVLGDVIENLSLRGLVNPSGQGLALDAEYRDFSLGELREGGAEYAVLLMAAVWCSSCRLSTLVAGERAHEVFEAGGTVLELLLDGATNQTPPTEAELRAWADAYELPMTTVGPVNDRARQVFTDREYAYIVELETMTVVWRHNMLYGNPTIVDQAIDTFLTDFQ